QASIAWASTDIDNFSLLAATTNFGNQDSVRGRLGGRLGTSWGWGGGILEPFATASVWHEFQGNNTVGLTSDVLTVALTDQFDDTWAELGGDVNYFSSGTTSIFFKGDALVGGELTGFNLKGGGRIGW